MSAAVQNVKTQMVGGQISPKAFLAFIFPAVGTLVLAVLDQVLSPDFDPTLKVAIVGVVNAILAFLGAYFAQPGEVERVVTPNV